MENLRQDICLGLMIILCHFDLLNMCSSTLYLHKIKASEIPKFIYFLTSLFQSLEMLLFPFINNIFKLQKNLYLTYFSFSLLY
jgi:hypothetical protein